jgi:hypothetical protein
MSVTGASTPLILGQGTVFNRREILFFEDFGFERTNIAETSH